MHKQPYVTVSGASSKATVAHRDVTVLQLQLQWSRLVAAVNTNVKRGSQYKAYLFSEKQFVYYTYYNTLNGKLYYISQINTCNATINNYCKLSSHHEFLNLKTTNSFLPGSKKISDVPKSSAEFSLV